jgi:predicted ATP-grasp superfamily ATP-dependent carboligase
MSLPVTRVLIPDGESRFAVKILWCLAQDRGLRADVLSGEPGALARFSRFCRHVHAQPAADDHERLRILLAQAERWGSQVLLPISLDGFLFLARHRAALSARFALPPMPGGLEIAAADDKWSFYKLCVQHDLPAPPTALLDPSAPVVGTDRSWASRIAFPALIKPAVGSGGRGIVRIPDPAALDRWAIQRQAEAIPCLIQSEILGTDICVAVWCERGEVLAHVQQNSFVAHQAGMGPQVAMEFNDTDDAIALTRRLMRALRWEGVAFVDLIRDRRDGRLWFLEINPRFGQAVVGAMRAGVNFPLIACSRALGWPIPEKRSRRSRYIHPQHYIAQRFLRLVGKGTPPHFGWRESGMSHVVSDPLPGLVEALEPLLRRVARWRRAG